LDEEPRTEKERAYQVALCESYDREAEYKGLQFGMQSTVVLQSMYCDHLSEQLAAQEEKKKRQKKGQLVGDGLPRLLTGDEFYQHVVEHEKVAAEEKIASENRQKQWEEQAVLLATWKEAEEARKQRNKERKDAYHKELHLWNEEKELAKQEKQRVGWEKPKRGKLEAAIRKPVVESGEGNQVMVENEENNGENDGEGMESDGNKD